MISKRCTFFYISIFEIILLDFYSLSELRIIYVLGEPGPPLPPPARGPLYRRGKEVPLRAVWKELYAEVSLID